ncbi:MAG: 30S ribosomal protein S14 [Verrucomicrobiota bacterium]
MAKTCWMNKQQRLKKGVKAGRGRKKNTCSSKVYNRCSITGRRRAYMRRFGVSRIQFREMALAGLIPGVQKASW